MASERKKAQWAAANSRRRRRVLEAAVSLAEEVGYTHLTKAGVADRAGVSRTSVWITYNGMLALKREVMAEAVTRGNVKIIAQGLAAGDPVALTAPHTLKQQAAAALV
jgi:AcrR family transcriptional regulator